MESSRTRDQTPCPLHWQLDATPAPFADRLQDLPPWPQGAPELTVAGRGGGGGEGGESGKTKAFKQPGLWVIQGWAHAITVMTSS